MARLRHGQDMQSISPVRRPLRIIASGTLFLTHTLSLPFHPTPSSVTRAHSVEKTRGGSASTVLSLLAQFSSVDAILVASLGGNDDGKMILRDLEREGVITRFCKLWANYGVPSAWVLQTGECRIQLFPTSMCKNMRVLINNVYRLFLMFNMAWHLRAWTRRGVKTTLLTYKPIVMPLCVCI